MQWTQRIPHVQFESNNLAFEQYSENDIQQLLPIIQGTVSYVKTETDITVINDSLQGTLQYAVQRINASEDEDDEEEEEEEEEVEDEEKEFIAASDLDALLNDSEHVDTRFHHSINSWYDNDKVAKQTALSVDNLDCIILCTFFMSYFQTFIIGEYASFVLGLRRSYGVLELCLPVSIGARLFSRIIHNPGHSHARRLKEIIKQMFCSHLKVWIGMFTDEDCHNALSTLKIPSLLQYFSEGLARYYPRAVSDIIFNNVVRLYFICTSAIQKLLTEENGRLNKGYCRIPIDDTLEIKVRLIPQKSRLRDAAWQLFYSLSNMPANYVRCAITSFNMLNSYNTGVCQVITLFHPDAENYCMLKLLHKYLRYCYEDYRQYDGELFPFMNNVVENPAKRIKYLYRTLSSYIKGHNSTSGQRHIQSLKCICLCRLLTVRDRKGLFLLQNFRSIIITPSVIRTIMHVVARLRDSTNVDLAIETYRFVPGVFIND